MSTALQLALFCGFTALAIGVAIGALQRIRRIQRQYRDPLAVARLLADDPPRDDRHDASA